MSTHIFDHLTELPEHLGFVADGLRSARIRVPIQTFELRDARRAHEMLESGATVGKLVLHV